MCLYIYIYFFHFCIGLLKIALLWYWHSFGGHGRFWPTSGCAQACLLLALCSGISPGRIWGSVCDANPGIKAVLSTCKARVLPAVLSGPWIIYILLESLIVSVSWGSYWFSVNRVLQPSPQSICKIFPSPGSTFVPICSQLISHLSLCNH